MNDQITQVRAAQRFQHIAELERQLSQCMKHIERTTLTLKDLKDQSAGLVLRIRAAARDEGELPLLFDTDDSQQPDA